MLFAARCGRAIYGSKMDRCGFFCRMQRPFCKNSRSLTDSLPYSAPKGVPIRGTIQELLETQSVRGVSVNMPQDWKEAYRAAVLEEDHHKLAEKIDLAITVLRQCLKDSSSPPEPSSERQHMEDALRTLDMIRRIELQIPA